MTNDSYNKYISNLREYAVLENKRFSGDDVVMQIQENTVMKKKIKNENDAIIASLEKYNEDISLLTDEEREDLTAFSHQLFNNGEFLDPAMFKRIGLILLKHAKYKQDIDEEIKQLLDIGTADMLIRYSLNESGNKYYGEIQKYRDQFDSFSSETKRNILYAVANYAIVSGNKNADSLIKNGLEIIEFFNDCKNRGLDIGVDYDANILVAKTNMANAVYKFIKGDGINGFNTTVVYEASKEALKLAEIASKDENRFVDSYLYVMYIAEYYHGIISLDELIEKLGDMSELHEEDSVAEKLIRLFEITAYYVLFTFRSDRISSDDKQKLINEKLKLVNEYADNLSFQQDCEPVDSAILKFLESVSETCTYAQIKDIVIKITLYRHKQTYIHTIIVSRIVKAITLKFLKENRAYFDGCFGTETDDAEILRRMDEMSIMHDVGKYGCMACIQNASRSLTDDEFDIIRKHPEFGVRLFSNSIPKYIKDGSFIISCGTITAADIRRACLPRKTSLL